LPQDIYDSGYIRTLFDRMSSSYDRMNYIFSFGFSHRWRRQFLEHIPKRRTDVQIIDLLTGMGETWKHVKTRFPASELTALDFSQGMLMHADKKNKKQFNNMINLVEQDVLNPSLPDEGFDAVICAFGLKTFNREQLQALATLTKRILKPGGHFSFIEVSIPGSKILKGCYMFHLRNIVPLVGKLFLGNPREYNMLWQYTERYSNSREVAAIFSVAGLEVTYDSYFNGCATGVHGSKL